LHFTSLLSLTTPLNVSTSLVKFSPETSLSAIDSYSIVANNSIMADDTKTKFYAILYCTLLAFQFGLQPMIANRLTAPGVSKSSVVIATEFVKIIIAIFSLLSESSIERQRIKESWRFVDSIKVAAVPATLYAIQNLAVQYGYVLLDSMTFNLLNQTKTLSAAFWLWIILDQRQSIPQLFALFLLLAAALVLTTSEGTFSFSAPSLSSDYQFGLIMVATASMLSGMSAALTQQALVDFRKRQPFFFSAEMALYGIFFLLLNLLFNNDIKGGGLFSHWDLLTLIPVITNACGGLIVGLVTKYAGGVVKGFSLIVGIIITGIAQYFVDGKPLGPKDGLGIVLVSVSIFLHSRYPPKKKPEKITKEQ